MLQRMKNSLVYRLGGQIRSSLNSTSHFVLPTKYKESVLGEVETVFTDSENRQFPIYQGYRYGVKKGFLYFCEINTLMGLEKKNLLTKEDQGLLGRSYGSRTIEVPREELQAAVKKYHLKHPELFLGSHGRMILKPDASETLRVVENYETQHRSLLDFLKTVGLFSSDRPPVVLEIGFISGGHSCFGWENLGAKVTAVDNLYSQSRVYEEGLESFLKKDRGSSVNFCFGDITKKNDLDESSFDIIYSISTLEHIQNLPGAFTEMKRLLKPGGIIVHHYHPFFSVDGGHALGVLDSPWGHVGLKLEDVKRYFEQLRPYEAQEAIRWFNDDLNKLSLNEMQAQIALSGFGLRHWEEQFADQEHLQVLEAGNIIKLAKANGYHIGVRDLIVQNVRLIAVNEK